MTDQRPGRYFQIGIRLTRAEYEAVKHEAERRDCSMAKLARKRLLRGVAVVCPMVETEAAQPGQLKAGGQ